MATSISLVDQLFKEPSLVDQVVGGEESPVDTERPPAPKRVFNLPATPYDDIMKSASEEHGVPYEILYSNLRQESQFNPKTVSKKGARGLGQFIPSTAKAMGITDPHDPKQAVTGSAKYLRQLYDQFGDWKLAVAAYNAGPGAVKKAGNKIPNIAETQEHIKRVFRDGIGDDLNAPVTATAQKTSGQISLVDQLFKDEEVKSESKPFDAMGSDYDYDTAKLYGLKPDASGHWPSRVPKTGLILKGRGHETWSLTEKGEQKAGYKIVERGGRYYSVRDEDNPREFYTRTSISPYFGFVHPAISAKMGMAGFGPKPGGWDELGRPTDDKGVPYANSEGIDKESLARPIVETLKGLGSMAMHPIEVIRGGLDYVLSTPGFGVGMLAAAGRGSAELASQIARLPRLPQAASPTDFEGGGSIIGSEFQQSINLEKVYDVMYKAMEESMKFFEPGKALVVGEPTKESQLVGQIVMAPMNVISKVFQDTAGYEGFNDTPNIRGALKITGDVVALMSMGYLLHGGSRRAEFAKEVEGISNEAKVLADKEILVNQSLDTIVKNVQLKELQVQKQMLEAKAAQFAKKFGDDIVMIEEAGRQAEQIAQEKMRPVVESPEIAKTFKQVERKAKVEELKQGEIGPEVGKVVTDPETGKKTFKINESEVDRRSKDYIPASEKETLETFPIGKETSQVIGRYRTIEDGLYNDAEGNFKLDSFKEASEIAKREGGTVIPSEDGKFVVALEPQSRVMFERGAIRKENDRLGKKDEGAGLKRTGPIVEVKRKKVSEPKVEVPEVEETLSPEAQKRLDRMIEEDELGTVSDIDTVKEVDKATGTKPIEAEESSSAFAQDREKAYQLRDIFKEREKSAQEDPEIYVQKLINDLNLVRHGEKLDKVAISNKLSEMAARAEELRDFFMTGADHQQFVDVVKEAAKWARDLGVTKAPPKGTRLNMMIPLDQVPKMIIDFAKKLFGTTQNIKLGELFRNKEMFLKTGFWLGRDGKFRYELDDTKANYWIPKVYRENYAATGIVEMKITEVMDYPELYKAVPKVKDITIVFDKSIDKQGYYDPNINEIVVKNLGDKKTFIHEVQHVVNAETGSRFRGTTVEAAGSFKNYWTDPGEMEARVAEVRRNMTHAERISELPWETLDKMLVKEGLDTGYGHKLYSGIPIDEIIKLIKGGKKKKAGDLLDDVFDPNEGMSGAEKSAKNRKVEANIAKIKDKLKEHIKNAPINLEDIAHKRLMDKLNEKLAEERAKLEDEKILSGKATDLYGAFAPKVTDFAQELDLIKGGEPNKEWLGLIIRDASEMLKGSEKQNVISEVLARAKEIGYEPGEIIKLANRMSERNRGILKPESKLYSGDPAIDAAAKAIIEGAKKVAEYTNKARGMKAFKPMEAARLLKEEFNRSFIDRSGNIRTELLDKLGEDGYKVVQKMVLSKGASARSAAMLKQMGAEVYEGLSRQERKVLDDIILDDRMIDIAKYKDEMQFKFPKNVKVKDFIAHRELFPFIEKLSPERASLLDARAKAYFEWMKKPLQDMLESGLIDQKEYDNLASHNYRKIKLVEIYDRKKPGVGTSKKTVYDSGVEALSRGRDTDIYEPSSEIMALEVFNRSYGRIMNNEANKSLLDLARKDPSNEFARIKNEDVKIPPGWTRVFAFEDGERKSIYISPEMAKEWINSSPEMSYRLGQFIRWSSGSVVTRTFATGIEWGFALANLPRDMMHLWFAARTYEGGKMTPIYNPNIPAFGLQIGRDIGAVFNDAALKKGRYNEYIKEGGGMEFLVHQGRLFQRGRHLESGMDKVYNFLGYFGETSEVMTRLAIRERVIRNKASELGISMKEARKNKDITSEATFAARDYMDFGQGGGISKALDNGLPYLNATIQGTRGLVRSLKPGSGSALSSTYKLGQLAALTTGVYVAAKASSPNTMQALQGDMNMQNNLCIPLGDSFAFEDEQGQTRYPYIKIPLDPGQKFFKTFFEGAADKWLGNEVDVDRITGSLSQLSPVGLSTLPPTIAGVVGYATNKDFWLNEDIWKRTDKPFSYPNSKEEFTNRTPQAFVDVGKATGLSPERTKYALEQLVTRGSMWSYLVNQGYDKAFGDIAKEKKEQHLAMTLSEVPAIKRFFGVTKPYSKYASKIDQAEESSTIKKFVENRGMDTLVDSYLYDVNTTREQVVDYALSFEDPETFKRLMERFRWEEAIQDLPEKSFWRRMKGLNLDARVRVFVDRLNKANPVQEEQLWNEFGIVAGAGGVVGKEFMNEVSRVMGEEQVVK